MPGFGTFKNLDEVWHADPTQPNPSRNNSNPSIPVSVIMIMVGYHKWWVIIALATEGTDMSNVI